MTNDEKKRLTWLYEHGQAESEEAEKILMNIHTKEEIDFVDRLDRQYRIDDGEDELEFPLFGDDVFLPLCDAAIFVYLKKVPLLDALEQIEGETAKAIIDGMEKEVEEHYDLLPKALMYAEAHPEYFPT